MAISLSILFIGFPLSPAQAGEPKILVFAASSLSSSFVTLGKVFEKENSGFKVQFSFQSSSTLATQILAGAPADIFASASPSDMQKVSKIISKASPFASNYIVLAALQRAKVKVGKLTDLNQPSLKWVQCAHAVPCGVATDRALRIFGKITSKPVSLEANASSVVAKLLAQEVDAGFIYFTDYKANSENLNSFSFADKSSAKTQYFIGKLSSSKNGEAAGLFLKLVLSPAGQAVLNRTGFSRST